MGLNAIAEVIDVLLLRYHRLVENQKIKKVIWHNVGLHTNTQVVDVFVFLDQRLPP